MLLSRKILRLEAHTTYGKERPNILLHFFPAGGGEKENGLFGHSRQGEGGGLLRKKKEERGALARIYDRD